MFDVWVFSIYLRFLNTLWHLFLSFYSDTFSHFKQYAALVAYVNLIVNDLFIFCKLQNLTVI